MKFASLIFKRLRAFLQYHVMLFANYLLLAICISSNEFLPIEVFTLLLSYLLTGVGAFLVNDFFDRNADAKSAKPNLTQGSNPIILWAIIIVCFSVSYFLIAFISQAASLLLLTQLGLVFAYSVPGIRLKSRAIIGIVTDALYAYVVPLFILFAVYGVHLNEPKSLFLLCFNFFIGIRDIVLHQLKDVANDKLSGINTFVIQYNNKVQQVLAFSEVGSSVTLAGFLLTNINFEGGGFWFWVLITSYFVFLLIQLVNIKKAIENNYIIRYYVVTSTILLGLWLIEGKQYLYLILLFHPYLIQLFVHLKSIISLFANYVLYYLFRLFGRNLKERPLKFKR